MANCAPTGSTTPLSISINISALLCIPHTETCLRRRELAASEETWNAMASYIWSDMDVIKPAEGKEKNKSVRRCTPRRGKKGALSKRVHDPSKLLRSASTWQWIGTRVLFALRKKTMISYVDYKIEDMPYLINATIGLIKALLVTVKSVVYSGTAAFNSLNLKSISTTTFRSSSSFP